MSVSVFSLVYWDLALSSQSNSSGMQLVESNWLTWLVFRSILPFANFLLAYCQAKNNLGLSISWYGSLFFFDFFLKQKLFFNKQQSLVSSSADQSSDVSSWCAFCWHNTFISITVPSKSYFFSFTNLYQCYTFSQSSALTNLSWCYTFFSVNSLL